MVDGNSGWCWWMVEMGFSMVDGSSRCQLKLVAMVCSSCPNELKCPKNNLSFYYFFLLRVGGWVDQSPEEEILWIFFYFMKPSLSSLNPMSKFKFRKWSSAPLFISLISNLYFQKVYENTSHKLIVISKSFQTNFWILTIYIEKKFTWDRWDKCKSFWYII